MPVHLGGSVGRPRYDPGVATARSVPVVEDACQAHLAEWRGRKVGTLGKAGCFSFQASKNLNSGEGGAIVTDDEALVDEAATRSTTTAAAGDSGEQFLLPAARRNLRMTEFQAALLMAQMTRLEAQARTREENAAYLTRLLKQIPGITPARMYEGCTRNAYHLYMFRYDPSALRRPAAGGVPQSAAAPKASRRASGYSPLNKEPFLEDALSAAASRRSTRKRGSIGWRAQNHCPQNDRLCAEAVWLVQTMLLGPRAGHGGHRRGRAQGTGACGVTGAGKEARRSPARNVLRVIAEVIRDHACLFSLCSCRGPCRRRSPRRLPRRPRRSRRGQGACGRVTPRAPTGSTSISRHARRRKRRAHQQRGRREIPSSNS